MQASTDVVQQLMVGPQPKTIDESIWAGPGAGKSTTAAKAFAKHKDLGHNVELVREHAKEWAWEGRRIQPLDQWYFLGTQSRAETSLFGKVSHIVTDSPFLMGAMYAEQYGGHSLITRAAYDLYQFIQETTNVEYRHILLKRKKAYNPKGRYESEEQARAFDDRARRLMDRLNIEYQHLTAEEYLASIV